MQEVGGSSPPVPTIVTALMVKLEVRSQKLDVLRHTATRTPGTAACAFVF